MDTIILLIAFSWLALGGATQIVLVICHSLRGRRSPNRESTLYYGLNASFGFGQTLYGLFGLLLIGHAPFVVHQAAFLILTSFALFGWLALNLIFMDLQKPKLTTIIFGLLLVAGNLVSL